MKTRTTSVVEGISIIERNGTDDFDRAYNCGQGINHFGYYGDNLYQYGSNGIYSPFGYSGKQSSNLIRYGGVCKQFNKKKGMNRFRDKKTSILEIPCKKVILLSDPVMYRTQGHTVYFSF